LQVDPQTEGAQQMASHHSPQFLALVEDAKRRIREVSASEVKQKLDKGEDFHLVDVREAEERDIETTVPDFDAEVVLYCGGGYRSALSADNMQKMGYRRVTSLAGGWRGWLQAGFPTTKDS
jgi:rhodanese-related sulfurtransferase